MGKDEHDVALADRLVFKKHLSITFSALEPEQSFGATAADDVGPHQAHIHERTEAGVGAVAGKHVLYWKHGMAAAEHVYQAAFGNDVSHNGSGFFDVVDLRLPDFCQHCTDLPLISASAHMGLPLFLLPGWTLTGLGSQIQAEQSQGI